ncbi:MAG: TolC family protein, partial [Sphingomonadaceae bacterium]
MPPRPIATLPLLALAACTVGPEHRPPAVTGETAAWITPAEVTPVDIAWWQRLDDPLLTRLIERAASANLDLREAEARLREARANRDAAAGRRLPEISTGGSATANQLSKNGQIPVGNIPGFDRSFTLFDMGFDASWEIDLWGHATRSVEAAEARAQAAEAARQEATLQVIAEVARNYIDLRKAQARAASVRADAEARAKVAALTEQRYRAGEA